MELKIEYLPLEALKLYKGNARKHTDKDLGTIIESIKAFGMNDPIGIWSDENIIVEGHGRYMACSKLKIDTVPVVRLDHLSDEQRRAYALAHNKTAELSAWDEDLLAIELDDIFNIDMSALGFDILTDEEDPEAVEDDYLADELPAEPKAQAGQIYKLGDHRLMCGDSTNEEDILKLLNGVHPHLFLSDPPYGVNIVKADKVGGDAPFGKVGFGEKGKNKIIDCNTYIPIKGDDTTDTARLNYEIIKKYTSNQIIFGGNYFTDFLQPKACWLVWDKENTGNFADVELAWTSFDKGAKLYRWLWNGLCRAGDRKTEGVSRVHPTQKPVGLMGKILTDFTEKGQMVLDCFGGSGSTLIACEQLGRPCYMIEYEPGYVDIIIDRWEKFTGKTAELL